MKISPLQEKTKFFLLLFYFIIWYNKNLIFTAKFNPPQWNHLNIKFGYFDTDLIIILHILQFCGIIFVEVSCETVEKNFVGGAEGANKILKNKIKKNVEKFGKNPLNHG